MSILKNFVNPWGLDTGVLDTGVLDTDVLKTSVLETSVLDSINGGGGKIIVFTEDGKELHRMQGDGIENAIVVMSNKQIKTFNHLKNALLKKLNTGEISKEVYNSYFDSKNVHLMYRGHGISYMVDGMLELWDKAREKKLLLDGVKGQSWSRNGKKVALYSEYATELDISAGNVVKVIIKSHEEMTANHPYYCNLNTLERTIHTHTNGYIPDLDEKQYGKETKIGIGGDEKAPPSSFDYNNASGKPNGQYFDIAITPNTIWLYRHNYVNEKSISYGFKEKEQIEVPVSFFK
jgi:hypothetical protein